MSEPHRRDQSPLEKRLQALEELSTYQEHTIDALNEVVLELRRSVEKLEEQVTTLMASAKAGVNQPGEQDSGLPIRPGIDPEAPPHY